MVNLVNYSTLSFILISLFQNNYIRFQKGIKYLTFLSATELLQEIPPNEIEILLEKFDKQIKNNQIINILSWQKTILPKPKDVILYGFGRIGRSIARILLTYGNYPLRLKYVVTRPGKDLKKRINLFLHDSVHGSLSGHYLIKDNCLEFNFHKIFFIESETPDQVDYPTNLVDPIIIDNTGKWRNKEQLEKHQKNINAKIILTCPGENIPNIVFGCNHVNYLSAKIVSAASCTTNAVVPILNILENKIGIIKGHIETVHSYTNDQNLIDNYHKKSRRDRSAALNIVPTTTGASKAAVKCIPSLAGKLTSSALRTPIPDVSLAIMILELKSKLSKDEIHKILFDNQYIGRTNNQPVVSSDLLGNIYPCVIDTAKTVVNENNLILYSWYDNEIGYSWQVIRLAENLL